MVNRKCITKEPDWNRLRHWLWEQEAMAEHQERTNGSVLCVDCRQWFVWPPRGLVADERSGQPVYRCAGCEFARSVGYESWDQLRLEVGRASMRRFEALRGIA